MIEELVEMQLAEWPMAKKNYDALALTQRRRFSLGDLDCAIQHNPARAVSTAANLDPKAISVRPCFLCKANRPKEQFTIELLPDVELLVNPFPIFPIHLTLPYKEHTPQDRFPLEMAAMAEMLPGMAVFFNGACAGASAPDHKHCQAVLKCELPLIRLAEKIHHPGDKTFLLSHDISGLSLPLQFISVIITPDKKGSDALMKLYLACGLDSSDICADPALQNVFFWIRDDGILQALVVARRAHRPSSFFLPGDEKVTVSPGAIDMTGVIVAPVLKDFENLKPEEIAGIYSEVAYRDRLPLFYSQLLS